MARGLARSSNAAITLIIGKTDVYCHSLMLAK
jgi:hypothetical protein